MNETVLYPIGPLTEYADDLTRFLDCPPRFLELLPVAVYACDAAGRVLWFNKRAADLWGRAPLTGDDAELFCGSHRLYFGGREIARDETPMAEVLRTGEPVHGAEGTVERPDGSQIRVMVHIDPVKDAAGRLVGAINCFHDISELSRAQDKVAESERRLRQLLEALPAAIYTTDADGRIDFYNQAAVDLSGRRPAIGSDEWCVTWRLYWPDGTPLPHDECPMAVALKENRPIRGAEAVAERPDGTRVPFIPYPTPLRDASGTLVGAVNMLVDITERKRAEERQNALLAELNHRVKNTLATVQSIAAQTIRGADIPEDIRRSFDGRLFALSGAHDQLARDAWESAEISAMVRDVLAPHLAESDDRVRIAGEPVRLPPKTIVTLAMVLHELAANAATHGSLSAPGGAVSIDWTEDEPGRVLRIAWHEAGGPPVVPPVKSGFGMRLLHRGIESELRGDARMTFHPAGLRVVITIPLSPDAAA